MCWIFRECYHEGFFLLEFSFSRFITSAAIFGAAYSESFFFYFFPVYINYIYMYEWFTKISNKCHFHVIAFICWHFIDAFTIAYCCCMLIYYYYHCYYLFVFAFFFISIEITLKSLAAQFWENIYTLGAVLRKRFEFMFVCWLYVLGYLMDGIVQNTHNTPKFIWTNQINVCVWNEHTAYFAHFHQYTHINTYYDDDMKIMINSYCKPN